MSLFLIIVAILIIMSIGMFLDLQSKQNITPESLIDNKPAKKENTIIKITMLEKYIQGAVIDRQTMDLMQDAKLENKEHVSISTKKLYEIEQKLNDYLEKRESENHVHQLKIKARKLEKNNQLNQASSIYLQIFDFCQKEQIPLNRYLHDIERLLIIYRKTKQYDKENDFLKTVLSKFPDYKGWEEMLIKSQKTTYTK